jgi:hypothetical protein
MDQNNMYELFHDPPIARVNGTLLNSTQLETKDTRFNYETGSVCTTRGIWRPIRYGDWERRGKVYTYYPKF